MTAPSTALPLSNHKVGYELVVRTARTWKISRPRGAGDRSRHAVHLLQTCLLGASHK